MTPDRIDLTDDRPDPLDEWAEVMDAGIIDLDNPQVTVELQLALGPALAEKCVTFTDAIKRAEARKEKCDD